MNKNKLLEDFYWAFFAPEIIIKNAPVTPLIKKNTHFSMNNLCAGSYILTKKEEDLLHQFVENHDTHLIGKYFEVLFEFGLRISPEIEIIAANEQISDPAGNTLGEVDYIFKTKKTNQFYHLEIAGKFYISHQNKSDLNTFFGPNPNDTLAGKINHFENVQTKILNTPAGQNYLAKNNFPQSIQSCYLMKGYLFYHYKHFLEKSFAIPPSTNPNHLKGWWVKNTEINLINNSDIHYLILQRDEWMKTMPRSKEDLLSFDYLKEKVLLYFGDNNYPILISRFRADNGCYTETDRGFIVSEIWPDTEQL